MAGLDLTYIGAALGGLLSFFSPCVLPLVPAYLCFLGGVSMEQLTGDEARVAPVQWRVVSAAALFVAGFSTVFIALGATATLIGQLLAENLDWLSKIAGVVIVLFGLHFADLLPIRLLNYERRINFRAGNGPGFALAYLLGLAFAFGWTPCVGPVLATILFLAAGEGGVGAGMGLLAMYALGIGIPFLVAALAARPFVALLKRFRAHMRAIELTIGGMLIVTGLLIFSGSLSWIGQRLLETFPDFGRVG